MPQLLHPDDPRLTWQGAVSLQRAKGQRAEGQRAEGQRAKGQRAEAWVMPWRIPYEDRALFPPDALQERAAMPAGVRIAFHSDTSTIAGQLVPRAESSHLDLYCDGQFHGSVELAGRGSFAFEEMPPGEKLIELWLPQIGEFRLKALEVGDGAAITRYDDPRPRWTTYGSSITHRGTAERPGQTWPAIVARGHGLNLTCLGYGGQCHLEPMMARMIRDFPADFLSMKVGINIHGQESLNLRTFGPAIIGFIEIVREKHPDTPFVVISPIFSPPREETPNAAGFNLQGMREEVPAAVNAIQAHGDTNIHYVDGLKLFGPEYAHLLPDQLHPDAEGYKILGQNFLREVAAPFFPKDPATSV